MLKNSNQNPVDEILSFKFDLRPQKMYMKMSNMSQFCEGLSKGLI